MADREKWALYKTPEGREDDYDYIPPSCIAPIWPEEDEWRPIKDFPNYEVSIYGDIIDTASVIGVSLGVRQFEHTGGYLVAHLRDDCGNAKTVYVHRIVAETFIPNPHNLPCVNHIDGCKGNNMINNLEWVSYSENNEHAEYFGLANNHSKKMPIKIRIIETGEEYDSIRECARHIGVAHISIRDCLNSKRENVRGLHFERIY